MELRQFLVNVSSYGVLYVVGYKISPVVCLLAPIVLSLQFKDVLFVRGGSCTAPSPPLMRLCWSVGAFACPAEQAAAAEVWVPVPVDFEKDVFSKGALQRLLVLDGLQDPGNLVSFGCLWAWPTPLQCPVVQDSYTVCT